MLYKSSTGGDDTLKYRDSFVRTVFSIFGIIIISKILGFVKQIVVAGAFGATIETDLISLSEGLTVNIEYVIVQTLITAFVPIYIQAKARSEADSSRLVSDSLKIFAGFSAVLAVAVILLAPALARIIAPTYDAVLTKRLAGYLRLFAPVLIFFSIQAILHALLNANEKFLPGQLIGFNQSAILIALTLTVGATFGPKTLAIGFVICPVYNVCYLALCARKSFHFERGKPCFSDDIRSLLQMIWPLLLGYAAVFINQQVDKIIVSGMAEGTVTTMGYSATLSNFVMTFIGVVSSIAYTRISKRIAFGSTKAASAFAICLAGILVTFFLPITIITMGCSEDIVCIVFQRGAFDEIAAAKGARALAGYASTFVAYAFGTAFSRLQYGHKNTKTPMINSSVGISFNIVLSILLYKPLGVFGVTLASSAAEFVTAALNMISAKRLGMVDNYRPLLQYLPIWLFGGVLCAVLAILGKGWFEACGALLRFALITLISGGAYAIIAIPPILKTMKRNALLK